MLKKIGIAAGALLVAIVVLFFLFTMPVNYQVEPDGEYINADASGIERPFYVDREEYPFASNWIEYNGATMHYLDEGTGTPVVLCHGNPTWSFLYRNIIKELDGEARLIAPDLPSLGFSGTPDDFDYKPKSHSKYLEHLLLNELELDEFIMVVQDWGGPTCLNIATQHPDKVLGLVVSNTWAWPAEGSLARASNFMKSAPVQRVIINRNGLGDMLMDMMLPEMDNRDVVLKAYAHAFPTPESRKPTSIFPPELTRSSEWLAEIESRLPVLEGKPVEFIFGMADREMMSEYNIAKWKTYFPNNEIQVVEDAKHFTQEDTPESYIIAIRRLLAGIEVELPTESEIE